jgi:hypothetical protein
MAQSLTIISNNKQVTDACTGFAGISTANS